MESAVGGKRLWPGRDEVCAGREGSSILEMWKEKKKACCWGKKRKGRHRKMERCILYFSCPDLRGYTRPHANTRNTSTSYPMECSFTELQLHQKDIIMS